MKKCLLVFLILMLGFNTVGVYGNDDNYVAIYMDSYSYDTGSYLDGRNIKGRIMISAFGVDWGFGAKVKYGSNANEIILQGLIKQLL